MADARVQLEAQTQAYQQLQKGACRASPRSRGVSRPADLSRAEQARGQCAQQLSENDLVMQARRALAARRGPEAAQELERLDEEASVYKLVGPVLVKQDLVEARSNVSKRLEFIRNERRAPARARGAAAVLSAAAASGWPRRSPRWRPKWSPHEKRRARARARRRCDAQPPPQIVRLRQRLAAAV